MKYSLCQSHSLNFRNYFAFFSFSRLEHLQGDAIAGLTVGLTVIPQGLAYAQVAELPPQVRERMFCTK